MNNKEYHILVSDLLIRLTKIRNSIILKRKYLYENQIIELKNELNISYDNALEVIDTVYKDYFDNCYMELIDLIEFITIKIIENNFSPEDFYKLNEKEYNAIYRSNI